MKKLLIVDDAELNRDILKEIFKGQFEILEAVDGEQALNIIDGRAMRFRLYYLILLCLRRMGLRFLHT